MVIAATTSVCLILIVVFIVCNYTSPDLFLASKRDLKIRSSTGSSSAQVKVESSETLEPDNNSGVDENVRRSLVPILNHASFDNRTVIIATLNKAWATGGMMDLFLESFRSGDNILHLLEHLVFVTMDPVASEVCNSKHKHCYSLETPGLDLSGENRFMTPNYLEGTKRRIRFLGDVLRLGFSFIYTDLDIIWLRSPLQHFSRNADVDLSCNHDFNGNSSDIRNHINGGLLHVRANNRTIRLYELWYDKHAAYPNKNDQDVFEAIKQSSEFERIGLRIKFVPTEYLSGYCHMNADLEKTCTMHAICCIGQQDKLDSLRRSLEDWVNFRSMTPQESREAGIRFRSPTCSI